jgi:riboflavin kinase/FMN adenylyltransferase
MRVDGSQACERVPRAVAIGNFDGYHLGHRAVVARLLQAADGLRSTVYTFDPAPTAVVAPARHQARLCTLEERVARLEAAGVDEVVVEPFTAAFAGMSAEDFRSSILAGRLGARRLVVGWDFRYGAGRAGTVEELRHRFGVEPVGAVLSGGEPVSSSRIRKLVAAGDVEGATTLLGRPPLLTGTVVHGERRGRILGFPTANLEAREELLPGAGVYATRVTIGGCAHRGVTNIGVRPTFGAGRVTVETHLLDGGRDLYGCELRLEFVSRIREERRFDGLEALVTQIRADVAAARERLR